VVFSTSSMASRGRPGKAFQLCLKGALTATQDGLKIGKQRSSRSRMLPTQRRQAILAEVRQTRAVSAEELARRFGVSLETIRRDLRGLRDRGLLERVYGGALSVRSSEGDFAT